MIFILEAILLGLVFKEVYDLLFVSEAEAKREIQKNRQLYLERRGKPRRGIDY